LQIGEIFVKRSVLKRSRLLIFGSLARAPSKECGRCLLTKFGLAQFTVWLFWRLDGDWCRALNIFDASPPHKAALLYSRPICATSHDPD
jgi:hypothetical protein